MRIRRHGRTLRLGSGVIVSSTGRIACSPSSLLLAGHPLVPGHLPQHTVSPFFRRLHQLSARLHHLQPSFILGLRCIISYAIAKVDYLAESTLFTDVQVARFQVAVNKVARHFLRLPSYFPLALLRSPLRAGGFALSFVIINTADSSHNRHSIPRESMSLTRFL